MRDFVKICCGFNGNLYNGLMTAILAFFGLKTLYKVMRAVEVLHVFTGSIQVVHIGCGF